MSANGDRQSLLPVLPESVPVAVRGGISAAVNRALGGAGPLRAAVRTAEDHLVGAASVEEAIDRLVATHVRLAGVSGFLTGLGGLASLPVTLPAGLGGLYLLAARMVVGIAHLRGYDVESEEVRSAVAVCLLGSAGVKAASRALVTKGAARLGRAVPFVGGPVGGAVDIVACRAIAAYAKRVFVPINPG